MDFTKLGIASFRVWTYFCRLCKKRPGGVKDLTNRFIRGGCSAQVAKELDYNTQTISQAIHTLKQAGFITEVRDPVDARKSAYFLHVILMGECVALPENAEKYVVKVSREAAFISDSSRLLPQAV